jgi:hypothetical protein
VYRSLELQRFVVNPYFAVSTMELWYPNIAFNSSLDGKNQSSNPFNARFATVLPAPLVHAAAIFAVLAAPVPIAMRRAPPGTLVL